MLQSFPIIWLWVKVIIVFTAYAFSCLVFLVICFFCWFFFQNSGIWYQYIIYRQRIPTLRYINYSSIDSIDIYDLISISIGKSRFLGESLYWWGVHWVQLFSIFSITTNGWGLNMLDGRDLTNIIFKIRK